MQANWIGRSEGCDIAFPYAPDTRRAVGADGTLKVFTTRADTLLGVTFWRSPRSTRWRSQPRAPTPRSRPSSTSAAAAA